MLSGPFRTVSPLRGRFGSQFLPQPGRPGRPLPHPRSLQGWSQGPWTGSGWGRSVPRAGSRLHTAFRSILNTDRRGPLPSARVLSSTPWPHLSSLLQPNRPYYVRHPLNGCGSPASGSSSWDHSCFFLGGLPPTHLSRFTVGAPSSRKPSRVSPAWTSSSRAEIGPLSTVVFTAPPGMSVKRLCE